MRTSARRLGLLAVALPLFSFAANLAPAGVSYLHTLANVTGPIPFNHVHLFADRGRDEIYVADGDLLRVFNAAGMETYRFPADPDMAGLRGIVVDEKGEIYALRYERDDPSKPATWSLRRWSYRGDELGEVEISGMPPPFASMRPDRLAYRKGEFTLVSSNPMLAMVVGTDGRYLRGYDLASLLEIPMDERAATDLTGFSLDRKGNLLLTVAVLFRGFVIARDGTVAGFGKPGSAPGSFGVIAGIASDDRGNIFVADKLRSVVLVFDGQRQFVTEFGYMGDRPSNLVRPADVAVDGSGRIYVTQLLNRGVSVFQVTSHD